MYCISQPANTYLPGLRDIKIEIMSILSVWRIGATQGAVLIDVWCHAKGNICYIIM